MYWSGVLYIGLGYICRYRDIDQAPLKPPTIMLPSSEIGLLCPDRTVSGLGPNNSAPDRPGVVLTSFVIIGPTSRARVRHTIAVAAGTSSARGAGVMKQNSPNQLCWLKTHAG